MKGQSKSLVFWGYVWILVLLVFARSAVAEEIKMPSAQQRFNTQAYNLLQGNKVDGLEQLIRNVPDCLSIPFEEITEKICTNDRTDGQKYVRRVSRHKAAPWLDRGNIICLDCAIYEGLTVEYQNEYGENPTKLNPHTYRAFYNKYRHTWLAPFVEETMTQLWQPGKAYDGMTSAGISFGNEVYTTLYVSFLADFDDIFKYVSPRLYIFKYRAGTSYIYLLGFLKEMEEMSRKTNTPELWKVVKRIWLSSLLEPEVYGDAGYYEGRKQKLIIEFFNKFGWDLFVKDGYVPTQWQRHTATLYGRACDRMTTLAPKACELYREGIVMYGISEDMPPAPAIQEEVSREVQLALTHTTAGSLKGEINE